MPWSFSSPRAGAVGAYCSGSRPSRISRLRRWPTRRARRWPFSNAPTGLAAKEVRASFRKRSDEAACCSRVPWLWKDHAKAASQPGQPLASISSTAHLATSEVFPSPPRATNVRTVDRPTSARRVFAHASEISFFSSSRPMSSAGAYLKTRLMSVRRSSRVRGRKSMTSRSAKMGGRGQSSTQSGMTFLGRLRAYSTSRFTQSDALDAAVMTTTKLSQFVIPSSILVQNFSSGWMALTSLKTSSKPAALRRNDSISAT